MRPEPSSCSGCSAPRTRTGLQGSRGDSWDRFWCRVQEMKQSCSILRQAIAQIPQGETMAKLPRKLKVEEGVEAYSRIESARGPLGPLSRFQIEEIIDPRDTRHLICEWVETAYRVVSQPARLVPRALQFRP